MIGAWGSMVVETAAAASDKVSIPACGIAVMVPLPALDRAPIEYVVAQARDPASDTRPFITFLRATQAKATLKSAGLQLIDQGAGAADASAGR